MKPLKIYFKILKVGNGKFLKTKDEVNNLIVDVINRNPSKPANRLREIALEEFHSNNAQPVLQTSSRFFISKVTDIEVIVTFLPEEKAIQEQFYTQWRYVQISAPYRLVQYLDENKVVVYSEKTRVLHTIKLEKDITVVVVED
ncbi:hypothetical protein [Pedobacter heparinus]|uniref:Uncharacterized protein n=1 Tax=Pedobacter heparinus (strain ATCC 13125 / DSM 2366 / CIP 104194 / JCM 7457 / NBRC 12017 / NCIMB 9290 / NRRL B-14731 / HIM 762-3) TaxID=485917 RepID=C6Y1D1_PEDHD|nr:hypothetical protein [Pedobacter heparinus]ACU02907.1 hypothetical protein Phep_0685 [Pedobacter heparinus DSM 2366]